MKNMENVVVVALLAVIAFVYLLQINAFPARAAPDITVSLNGYYDAEIVKGYVVLGEIENVGDTPATNISVTINGHDASNTFVNSTTELLMADGPWSSGELSAYIVFVLLPGAKVSFQNCIWDSMGGDRVDHCTSTVSFVEATNLPVGLQITVTKAEVFLNSLLLNGTIKNVGTLRADQVYIYGTCYDSTGAVIGSGVTSSEVENLNANQVADFGFSCTGGMESYAGKTVTYAITAQSFTGDEYSGVPQYTCTSEATGVIPEFPSIICMPLLLIAMSAVAIFQKKRQS